jgi:site-specific DNA recombinase
MSSDQQSKSPEQQNEECNLLESREGYHLVGEPYFDEGISGLEARTRPDFQRMMRDAANGEFDVITCWDQDRFGRFDGLDAGECIAPLRRAGVYLHTVAQGKIDWNELSGRLTYLVQQEGKSQVIFDLARNVGRGKSAGARRGNFQGRPAYGYDRAFFDSTGNIVHTERRGSGFARPAGWSTRLILNAQEAETVRWIFEQFASGRSIAGIARELNAREVPGPCAPQWFRNTVRGLLANRVYLGDTVYGKKPRGKLYFTGDGGEMIPRSLGGVNRPDGVGAFVIAKTHQAIIESDVWDRVQSKIEAQRTDSTRPRDGGYMLAGLARCGHCGRRLVASHTRLRDGRRLGYYRCEANWRFGETPGQQRRAAGQRGFRAAPGHTTCTCRCAPRETVERFVIEFVKREILSADAAARIERGRLALIQKDDQCSRIKTLERRTSELKQKIGRAAENVLLAGGPTRVPEAVRKLDEWKTELDRCEREKRTIERRTRDKREAAYSIAQVRERLAAALKGENHRAIRAALKTVLSEVRVYWKPYGNAKPDGKYRKFRVVRIEPIVRLEDA